MRHQLRCFLAVITDLQSADFDVLQEKIIRPDGRDAARREPNDDNPSTPGDGSQCRVEHITADHVQYDIGSGAVGCSVHLVAKTV